MAPTSAPSSSASGRRSRLERASRLKTRNPTPFMEISAQGLCSLRDACEFGAEDCVFDLGAGCGRIMAEILERYPCRGVAVEVNPSLARVAAERLSKFGERVRVVAQDLRRVDLREATAVVCFFTSVALEDLKRYLAAALSKGVVLINYAYPVPGWWTVRPPTDGVYKYRIGEHRSRPVLEEAPPLSEKLERKSNPISLAPLNKEAARRTWDPSYGWYPSRKRASIDDASSSLASVREPSQCSTAIRRSQSWSGSRRQSGDNSRPGREDRGIAMLGSQDASHAADEDRAVDMLHRAIDREDARLLRSAIGLGELSGFEDRLLDSARKHLLRLEAMEMLMRARDSRDPEVFKVAISKADVSDLPRAAVKQMKQILHGLEFALAQEEPLVEEGAALDVEPEVASRRGCVSLPSMQRHRSAPAFFLPGVEPNERTTL